MEMMVVMIVAVLLFGKRLPEVGRSLGKGIIEFKKGIRGIEDDFDAPTATATARKADTGPTVDSVAAALAELELILEPLSLVLKPLRDLLPTERELP